MENNTTLYDKVVEQLKYSEEILTKASKRVHDEAMTKKFESLAQQRQLYKNELKKILEVDSEDLKPTKALKASIDKIWIDVNHAYIRLNEGETIDVVLKAEQELAKLYENIILEVDQMPTVANIFRIQLSDFHNTIQELKSIRNEYKFIDK